MLKKILPLLLVFVLMGTSIGLAGAYGDDPRGEPDRLRDRDQDCWTVVLLGERKQDQDQDTDQDQNCFKKGSMLVGYHFGPDQEKEQSKQQNDEKNNEKSQNKPWTLAAGPKRDQDQDQDEDQDEIQDEVQLRKRWI